MRASTPLLQRLFPRVVLADPADDRSCWLWTGALTRAGYGAIGGGRRGEGTVYVHRALYERFVEPIPAGLDLDHLCRTPACCNPAHLEPVTRSENVRRQHAAQQRETSAA